MADIFREGLMIIGSYLGVIVLTLGSLQFFSAGFLFTWLQVKTSRGKKVLVKVRGIIQDYYRSGVIDGSFLYFKDKNKEGRRIKIPTHDNKIYVYRSIGVNNVYVDDDSNSVLSVNLEGVSGFDGQKFQELYVRALYKPNVFDSKEKIMLYVMIGCLVAIVAVGLLVFNQGEQITALSEMVGKPVAIPTT